MKALKWVLLTPLIIIGLVVSTFVGWNVAKGFAPDETCKLYKSMVHSIAAPGFVPSDDCRWVKRDPIGHFTVNGVPFTVPRAYLWLGGHDPDGAYDALYMMMRYPVMHAVPPDPYHDLNVMVTIRSTARHVLCVNEGKCDEIAQNRFWRLSGLEWCEQGREGCIYNTGKPENVLIHLQLGMKHFKNGHRGADDVFFQGNPLAPDHWFACTHPEAHAHPLCETVFQLNDKYFVEYRFRRRILGTSMLDVHQKVISKLKTFLNMEVPVSSMQEQGE